MKIFYLFFPVVFFFSCQSDNDLRIERKHKILVKNNNCDISFYYPVMVASDTNTSLLNVNETLYKVPDYEYYSHNCDKDKSENKTIKGDYNILLQNDSILAIEYWMNIQGLKGNKLRTVYHALVVNTKSITKNEKGLLWIASPELLIPNFDRGKLKPFVEKYNQTAMHHVNLLAYESDSRYFITWGITETKFILYVGGEGEAFGYEKIEIPLEEIRG